MPPDGSGPEATVDSPLAVPLDDRQVLAAIPVMAAELRDERALRAAARGEVERSRRSLEERQERRDAVADGRLDALAWSRGRAPRLPLPEGYRYSPACSRKATAAHPLLAVVVVLTSGLDSRDYAPERTSRLAGEEAARLMLADAFLAPATRDAMRRAERSLRAQGLRIGHGSYLGSGFLTLDSDDGRVCGTIQDHNASCTEMPAGPYVELMVEPDEPGAPGPEGSAPALERALDASGLGEEQYRAVFLGLVRARGLAGRAEQLGPVERHDVDLYLRLRSRLEPELGDLIRMRTAAP